MLAALQNLVLATGDDHSLLRKRSLDEMNSSVPEFEKSKRQAINIKDNDDVLGENVGPLRGGKSQLLPVEDSRSRSSDVDLEAYDLFKNDMSTSSNYVTTLNLLNTDTVQTQLCEHSAEILNDYSNEQLETLVDSIISSRNSENSLSNALSHIEEELSQSSPVQNRSDYDGGFDSFDDDFLNSPPADMPTESIDSQDLDRLAAELLGEEVVNNNQHELPRNDRQLERSYPYVDETSSARLSVRVTNSARLPVPVQEDRNQEHQLIKKPYFCPECLLNFKSLKYIRKIKHAATCRNQGFNNKNVWTIDDPKVIKHCKSADLYCLHPTKKAIYLQNSKGLNEAKVTPNADGSFTYYDGENIRVWDKFGFDDATRERLANLLETEFEIISRRPEDAKKEYFECPKQNCRELSGNQDYDALKDHLRERHNSQQPYICHYEGCMYDAISKSHLFDYHEIKHLGIEFICPFCAESNAMKHNLKNQHIKKQHSLEEEASSRSDLYQDRSGNDNDFDSFDDDLDSSPSVMPINDRQLPRSYVLIAPRSLGRVQEDRDQINIAHSANVINTNAAAILPRNEEASLLPSVSEDSSQESSHAERLEIDWLNENPMFDELSESDLFSLAQEVLAEEAHDDQNELPIPDEQSIGLEDRNQEHQLVRKPYFCPECLVNFNYLQSIRKIKHAATCRNHGFNNKDVWTIDEPIVIKHCKSDDIYCLHPTKGAIYLQNSKGLNEAKVAKNPDGSFTYQDIDNDIIKFWDKFGFDEESHQRLAKVLKTKFKIISRRPEDAQKEYFECPMQGCSVLAGNKNYEKLEEHLRNEHGDEKSYVCRYKDCIQKKEYRSQLFNNHEIRHLGIKFFCSFCSEPYAFEHDLIQHIKNNHPSLNF